MLRCVLIAMALLMPRTLCVAAKLNGFMGHYGYLVSVPVSLEVYPDFSGDMESVQFIPPICKKLPREQCINSGMFILMAKPKKTLLKKNAVETAAEYVVKLRAYAQKKGEEPGALLSVRVGGLKGWSFIRKNPITVPFNGVTYVEGKKVLYTFAYQSTNAAMGPIIMSLTEVQPHDTPPRGE